MCPLTHRVSGIKVHSLRASKERKNRKTLETYAGEHRARRLEDIPDGPRRLEDMERDILCVCVCVSVCMWYYPFYRGFPVGPVWPHWRPRVGSLPIIVGLQCRRGVRPGVAPRTVRYALGPEPSPLPQGHPGVVALWLPPGQLHSNSSTSPVIAMSPRVLCVYWGFHT